MFKSSQQKNKEAVTGVKDKSRIDETVEPPTKKALGIETSVIMADPTQMVVPINISVGEKVEEKKENNNEVKKEENTVMVEEKPKHPARKHLEWRNLTPDVMRELISVGEVKDKSEKLLVWISVNANAYAAKFGKRIQCHNGHLVFETPWMYTFFGYQYESEKFGTPTHSIPLIAGDRSGRGDPELPGCIKWMESFDRFIVDIIMSKVKEWFSRMNDKKMSTHFLNRFEGDALRQEVANLFDGLIRPNTDPSHPPVLRVKVRGRTENAHLPDLIIDDTSANRFTDPTIISKPKGDNVKWKGMLMKCHIEVPYITYANGRFYVTPFTQRVLIKSKKDLEEENKARALNVSTPASNEVPMYDWDMVPDDQIRPLALEPKLLA
jgi:hypothetical protein